jgi:hypothetical protein
MGPIWNENMKMKKEYERPRIAIRGIVLEESLAVLSPVKKVELEAWEEVEPESSKDFDFLPFQI